MKPILLAICGKSASGKDSLAKELTYALQQHNIPVNQIISYTTRPPRVGERDGIDYNFVRQIEFNKMAYEGEFIESAEFRTWFYGTAKSSIKSNAVNIVVLNPEGIYNIYDYKDKYTIIPIYINVPLVVRLYRSYLREHKWKWEFIRRAWTDKADFENNYFDITLSCCFKEFIYINYKEQKQNFGLYKILNNNYFQYIVNKFMNKNIDFKEWTKSK
ncbi:MAG TPA: hypothetical protein DEA28_02445 [Firmicutes bacterium]|nr:hypothetical protein [Bacillota bacterium]